MQIPTFNDLVQLAQQFGPFTFALLFILVITRTARGYYRDSLIRTDPPATPQERKTYRLYFLSSFWVGVIVMALAIGWWLYVNSLEEGRKDEGLREALHVYRVDILGLKPHEEIDTSRYWRKKTSPGGQRGESRQPYDVSLVILNSKPWKEGDRVPVYYATKVPEVDPEGLEPTTNMTFWIKYSGEGRAAFTLKTQDGQPTLVPEPDYMFPMEGARPRSDSPGASARSICLTAVGNCDIEGEWPPSECYCATANGLVAGMAATPDDNGPP